MIIHDKSVTSIELSLFWQNSDIFHTDCFFAKKVNFYRGIFPQKITDSLMGKSKGDTIEIPNIIKDIVSPYSIKFFIKYAPLTFFIKSIVLENAQPRHEIGRET